jgi:hypothetical protein
MIGFMWWGITMACCVLLAEWAWDGAGKWYTVAMATAGTICLLLWVIGTVTWFVWRQASRLVD